MTGAEFIEALRVEQERQSRALERIERALERRRTRARARRPPEH